MKLNDPMREFTKLLDSSVWNRRPREVFADFVDLSACAISNAVDLAQFDAREAHYMSVIGGYSKAESDLFPIMLAHLVSAFEQEPRDWLGAVMMERGHGEKGWGQFFTPYDVCVLMADMTLDAELLDSCVADKGYMTVCEPCCGAGAMLIALFEAVKKRGHNPQRVLLADATDIDRQAAQICYLQTSLIGLPARVVVGDTLRMEEREVWYTPGYMLFRSPAFRALARTAVTEIAAPADVDLGEYVQGDMFAA